jgi:hypothetical protein
MKPKVATGKVPNGACGEMKRARTQRGGPEAASSSVVDYSKVKPACFQASTPPLRAFTLVYPMSMYFAARPADVASFGQPQ